MQISHTYSGGLNDSSQLGAGTSYDAFDLQEGTSTWQANNQTSDFISSDFDMCFSRNGSPMEKM